MKVALVPLAFGTLATWLLAGPFWRFLQSALPAHEREAETTAQILMKIVSAPATLIVLAVVAAGVVAWFARGRLGGIVRGLGAVRWAAAHNFGFEAINRRIVATTVETGESLRATQTGLLGWNVLGIIAALAAVLGVLAMGGI